MRCSILLFRLLVANGAGLHAEYDQAMSDVKTIEAALETYLKEQKKLTGDNSMQYRHSLASVA